MNGLMMQQPLLISSLSCMPSATTASRRWCRAASKATSTARTYRQLAARSRRMAKALGTGREAGARRVATLAWNGYRHMELYYAVSGTGAVLHTLNPRLHPDQVVYIADHAEDQVLFFDMTFLPVIEAVAARVKTIKHFVAMTDRAHMPANTKVANLLCYEELVEAAGRPASTGRSSTRTPPARCATPRAPPATRRARCTATARRCCTRWPRPRPTR